MTSVEDRAIASGGTSGDAVYRMIAIALEERGPSGGTLLDVGCGRGELARSLAPGGFRYVGADVVRHSGFPDGLEFVEVNLDAGRVPLAAGYADAVVCAETIEHVENPRALVRELVRLARPGGSVLVTTPNQLSAASLLCLLARGQFQWFQEAPGLYPAHITALLEIDLRRIASECGLVDVGVAYSGEGRMPFSERAWPGLLRARGGLRGRTFSDNVLVFGTKPAGD
jgi:SAM-dependent methyltransferase